ncbi:MAG: hypothetical protein C0505_06885 [Leptothrix sp. (in: Bacteria)]|nr:hypothetical protein [Leptothrix sp. (in: b-proteobacteria)]
MLPQVIQDRHQHIAELATHRLGADAAWRSVIARACRQNPAAAALLTRLTQRGVTVHVIPCLADLRSTHDCSNEEYLLRAPKLPH